MSFSLDKIQTELQSRGVDGWLFYDFYGRDPIAYRLLDLKYEHVKRRWYYYLPAKGTPQKLVHKIESTKLDALPGEKRLYASWQEQRNALRSMMRDGKKIVMQYSPENAIPYVSLVDAGTVELIRGLGKEIVTSADLVQIFEARWSPGQLAMHKQAGEVIDSIVSESFARIGEHVKGGKPLTEYEQQQWMLEQFAAHNLITDSGPDVAINEHASDPHFDPCPAITREFRPGDWVLLDVWGKLQQPGSVYYDITWVGFIGDKVPKQNQKIFEIVREARDSTVKFALDRVAGGKQIRGFEVDDVARGIIDKYGYGEYFFHRLGHSIGEEVHGTGANMDNLEMHDDRVILPQTCFSVEPGIYLPEFGVRLEVDVYVGEGTAEVTGKVQQEIVRIGA